MATRSSWEGFLKLSLISVPVRAYNSALPGGGDIHFHQIHAKCGNRIHYQKVCPVHGEVSKDDIVSGYEYKKGEYVEFEKEELEKMRSEDEKAVNIDAFVPPEKLDPIYLSGHTLYLVPGGPAGQKPYALLHEIMTEKKRVAVGTVVMSGHDEIVAIRPAEHLLTMAVLYREDQLKPASAFEDEVKKVKASPQELKLASVLVDESTPKDFDFSHYKDHYTERISEAIEAKAGGKAPAKHAGGKAPHVINLMDALRKSLDQTRASGKGNHGKAPAAPTRRRRRAREPAMGCSIS